LSTNTCSSELLLFFELERVRTVSSPFTPRLKLKQGTRSSASWEPAPVVRKKDACLEVPKACRSYQSTAHLGLPWLKRNVFQIDASGLDLIEFSTFLSQFHCTACFKNYAFMKQRLSKTM
jgi:hypothetical protein